MQLPLGDTPQQTSPPVMRHACKQGCQMGWLKSANLVM